MGSCLPKMFKLLRIAVLQQMKTLSISSHRMPNENYLVWPYSSKIIFFVVIAYMDGCSLHKRKSNDDWLVASLFVFDMFVDEHEALWDVWYSCLVQTFDVFYFKIKFTWNHCWHLFAWKLYFINEVRKSSFELRIWFSLVVVTLRK